MLVEGISVVIRCRPIAESYVGGQTQFTSDVPNRSLRADGELAAITFMTPSDAQKYVAFLEGRGLKHTDGKEAIDMVVADQYSGLRAHCGWAVMGTTLWNNNEGQLVTVCQSVPTKLSRVVAPENWKYETSLTATGVYVPFSDIPKSLKLIRQEQGRDVFWDESSRRELYVYH